MKPRVWERIFDALKNNRWHSWKRKWCKAWISRSCTVQASEKNREQSTSLPQMTFLLKSQPRQPQRWGYPIQCQRAPHVKTKLQPLLSCSAEMKRHPPLSIRECRGGNQTSSPSGIHGAPSPPALLEQCPKKLVTQMALVFPQPDQICDRFPLSSRSPTFLPLAI